MASDKMLGSFDQKSAPEDNDLLVEYDASASKVKNVKFGGVWNWIVKKLTSAVINELQTSSKNVVGAINELNSKIYIYSGRTGDKAQTIFFRFPQDAHMTGILYIDNNRYINIFAFGRMSGVANILNSASAVPSLNSNDNTVSVNLTVWGNCKLITMDRDVKVIGSL
nr:MAG TPA: hypothetical protein [Caudoviricetes sp.]